MKKSLSCFILLLLLYSCGSITGITSTKKKEILTIPKKGATATDSTVKIAPAKTEKPVNSTYSKEMANSKQAKATATAKQKKALAKKMSEFPVNKIANFYSVPFLILSIDSLDSKNKYTTIQKNKNEVEKVYIKKSVSVEELEANPQKYLDSLEIKYQRRGYDKLALSPSHKKLLTSLLSRTNKDQNKLALIFVNGYKLKHHELSQASVEKTIYAQYVTDYLYSADSKIRIEKRYIADIPENELFVIILGFDGKVPYNAYNAPKLDSIQWLAKYLDYDAKQAARKKRQAKAINNIIDNATNASVDLDKTDNTNLDKNITDEEIITKNSIDIGAKAPRK